MKALEVDKEAPEETLQEVYTSIEEFITKPWERAVHR